MQPDEIVATIIRDYMQIAPSRIVLRAQNFQAPKDEGLYVIVGLGNQQTIGSSQRSDEETETGGVTIAQEVTVDIVSKSRAAVERRNEAIIALRSTLAQQLMEREGARVFRQGGITDLTSIEASAALHRFRVSFMVHYSQSRTISERPLEQFRDVDEEVQQ